MPRDEAPVIISAQVPTATRTELLRRAEAGYRTLSSEVRLALDAHLRREQQPSEEGES